jgi:hypothetical protein
VSLDCEAARIIEQFTLGKRSDVVLRFMTALPPEILPNGGFRVGNATVYLRGAEFQLTVAPITIGDPKMEKSWGETLWRVSAAFVAQSGEITVTIS